MSTKKIRAVLNAVMHLDARKNDPVVVAALSEVEAIEKAARVVTDPAEAGNDEAHATAFDVFGRIARESGQ